MDREFLGEWHHLQDAAIRRLREGVDPPDDRTRMVLLVRYLIRPAFEPSFGYEIHRATRTEHPQRFRAVATVWRRDLDQAKFHSPVERLRHPSRLEPTIGQRHAPISSAETEKIMARLSTVRIPLATQDKSFGLDGVTHELHVGDAWGACKISWWTKPPDAWGEVAAIGQDVQSSVREAVARTP